MDALKAGDVAKEGFILKGGIWSEGNEKFISQGHKLAISPVRGCAKSSIIL